MFRITIPLLALTLGAAVHAQDPGTTAGTIKTPQPLSGRTGAKQRKASATPETARFTLDAAVTRSSGAFERKAERAFEAPTDVLELTEDEDATAETIRAKAAGGRARSYPQRSPRNPDGPGPRIPPDVAHHVPLARWIPPRSLLSLDRHLL
jgi:hypothetical protein